MEYEKNLIEKWFLTADYSELDAKSHKKIQNWLGPLDEGEQYLLIVGTAKRFMISETPYVVLTNKRLLNINPPSEIFQCFYKDITELSMKPSNLFGETPKAGQFKVGGVVPTVTLHGTAHKVLHYDVATLPIGFKDRVWTAIRENWMKSKS